jgi:hypothetical protein
MPTVRLRVTAVIDIDALDYLEAAEHQRRLEACLTAVRSEYPAVSISVKERRGARQVSQQRPRPFHLQSGKLHVYE